MSPKQELLAIQADAARIAEIALGLRDCVETDADDEPYESEEDAKTRRNEEFLNRERHR